MSLFQGLRHLSTAYVADAVARAQQVHVASTDAEREAIYRMRYQIYVADRGEPNRPGLDSARRRIHVPEDDLPDTRHYYVGSPTSVLAAIRMRTWLPGAIPEDVREVYSLDRFPDIDSRAICDVTYLMARPGVRGTSQVVALIRHAMEASIRASRVDAVFGDATPGLLHNYRRLGLRPYGARPVSSTYGILIPLIGVMADTEHARRCGAPWYPTMRRLAAEGALSPNDYRPLVRPTSDPGVELDPAAIAAELEHNASTQDSGFLSRLSAPTRRQLYGQSCLLDVGPDTSVVMYGTRTRDLFVIVSGELEVLISDRVVRTMTPGETFGEVSFFSEVVGRSATVRTKTPTRLLHVRQGALRRMAKQHPAHAVEIYAALAGVLAERLVDRD